MRLSLLLTLLSCTLLLLPALPAAADGHAEPFDVEDLVSMARISDPQVSPDGTQIAFSLRTTDLEADRGRSDLWIVDLEGEDRAPRRLTTHPASEWNLRWSGDGESLYFLSTRSGSSQVWRLPLSGGEAVQVTDLDLDVGNLVLSPTGDRIAVSMEVFVDCEDLACTEERLETRAEEKTSGHVYDQLFIRHWDTWKDGRRSHLFVLPLSDGGIVAQQATPIDVSAGLDADVPSKPFGGPEEITFTPDGKQIVYSARDAGKAESWSTDFNLYLAPVSGGEIKRLTPNPAWDTAPTFSPDGKTLAYLAMERPGFEADRFRIILRDWESGKERVLADDWDRSAGGMSFSPDGKTLLVTAQDTGEVPLFSIDIASGKVNKIVGGGHVRSPAFAGERIVYGFDHLKSPVDLYSTTLTGGEPERLTEINAERMEHLLLGDYEQFSFKGWNGEKVYGYITFPVGFDAEAAKEGASYPLAFLIHGGPQGSFDNDFHYRWNPQIYAAAGYAAVMIDFHGSTGYGQNFTDSISGDWGGKPLEDLQKGLAAALKKYPWIDGDRACALGASYGGYMINWIAGNWNDAFSCLVNHDGVFDLRSMYYSTEELWFPEWETGGPAWQVGPQLEKFNPAAFVQNWKTPMLVIHGALDFRVPETQGFQAFTALQRQGIPSRLLYYPDENHWVLKPNNSIQWHETVLDWLQQWTASQQQTAQAEE